MDGTRSFKWMLMEGQRNVSRDVNVMKRGRQAWAGQGRQGEMR